MLNEITTGSSNILLLRTDQEGNEIWFKTFGNISEVGYSIQQTPDGGFIILGSTESYSAGGKDVWLLKTDENGNTLWTRTYGGSDDDKCYAL